MLPSPVSPARAISGWRAAIRLAADAGPPGGQSPHRFDVEPIDSSLEGDAVPPKRFWERPIGACDEPRGEPARPGKFEIIDTAPSVARHTSAIDRAVAATSWVQCQATPQSMASRTSSVEVRTPSFWRMIEQVLATVL